MIKKDQLTKIYNEWIESIWKAILINTPDQILFKIEPMDKTKKLTFYTSKFS